MDIEFMIGEIEKEILKVQRSNAQRIAARILGAKINSWGEVQEVSDALVKEVSSYPKVKEVKETIIKEIVMAASKPLAENIKKRIVAHIRNRLIEKIEEECFNQAYFELKDAITTYAQKELEQHPKLKKYFVAARIHDAHKK